MLKYRSFLRAADAADRAAFRGRMLDEVAPRLSAAVPELAHLSLCLVDATPAVPPWRRPGEAAPAGDGEAFDAVVDLWSADEAAADRALALLADALPEARRVTARVTETIEKDELPRPAGARAPGVKFLALMQFRPDLPPPAARRLWAHHAVLALEVHVGMARYVRDWVEAFVPGAPADPVFHGVAELHFPSAEAMQTRWFDSELGRRRVVHDIGHFLERATRLYTTEHVLK